MAAPKVVADLVREGEVGVFGTDDAVGQGFGAGGEDVGFSAGDVAVEEQGYEVGSVKALAGEEVVELVVVVGLELVEHGGEVLVDGMGVVGGFDREEDEPNGKVAVLVGEVGLGDGIEDFLTDGGGVGGIVRGSAEGGAGLVVVKGNEVEPGDLVGGGGDGVVVFLRDSERRFFLGGGVVALAGEAVGC